MLSDVVASGVIDRTGTVDMYFYKYISLAFDIIRVEVKHRCFLVSAVHGSKKKV